MPPPTAGFTDEQLARLRTNDYGRQRGTVERLIDELIQANVVNRALALQCTRLRLQVAESEGRVKTGDRLLIIEVPANDGERCEWETLLYFDGTIDLRVERCPVPTGHPLFDSLLAGILAELPRRFQQMPWEVSARKECS